MRLPSGLVPAAAIWLFVGDAAAQVSGANIAGSAREVSRPHDVVPSPKGAFLYHAGDAYRTRASVEVGSERGGSRNGASS